MTTYPTPKMSPRGQIINNQDQVEALTQAVKEEIKDIQTAAFPNHNPQDMGQPQRTSQGGASIPIQISQNPAITMDQNGVQHDLNFMIPQWDITER